MRRVHGLLRSCVCVCLITLIPNGCGGGTRGTGVGNENDLSIPAREGNAVNGVILVDEEFSRDRLSISVKETDETTTPDESGGFALSLTARLGARATLLITVGDRSFEIVLEEVQLGGELTVDLSRLSATYSSIGSSIIVMLPVKEV